MAAVADNGIANEHNMPDAARAARVLPAVARPVVHACGSALPLVVVAFMLLVSSIAGLTVAFDMDILPAALASFVLVISVLAVSLVVSRALQGRAGGAGRGAPRTPVRPRVPVDRQVWEMLSRHGDDRARRQLQAFAMMGADRDFGAEDYDMLLALDEDTPTKQLARASRGEINRLPVIAYRSPTDGGATADSDGVKEEAKTRCLICLDDFEPSQRLRLLPCFHHFHVDCIDRWLGEKAECPVCKHTIRGDGRG